MWRTLTILLLVSLAGCERAGDGGKKGAPDSNVPPRGAGDSPGGSRPASRVEGYVRVFREAALSANAPPDWIDRTSEQVSDVLGHVRPERLRDVEVVGIKRLRQSFIHFLTMNGETLRAKKSHRRAAGYWLAFCLAETVSGESEGSRRRDEYRRLFHWLTLRVREELHKRIPADARDQVAADLAKGLEAFEIALNKALAKYNDDVLCPAFRGPISDVVRLSLTRTLVSRTYPRYEEPRELMVSKKARYLSEVKRFLTDTAWVFLYDIFVAQVKERLQPTPYWGYTKWSAKSVPNVAGDSGMLFWPALVRLRPDPHRNAAEAWGGPAQ